MAIAVADGRGAPDAERNEMPTSDDDRRAGDRDLPPVFESFPTSRIVRLLSEADPIAPGGDPRYSPEDVHEFRPSLRPPVPVLTVLDDGSTEDGEHLRLRRDRLAIGRTSGDVQLPNDSSISRSHAEIRCVPWNGGFQWQLHDLQSVNGTFVRCARAVLHEHAVLILGTRRFRLRDPLRPSLPPVAADRDTDLLEQRQVPGTVWPSLVEASARPGAAEFLLGAERLTIGRTGGGADVEIDDPLLANRHAELRRTGGGTWMIESLPTRNGIWVSVSAVVLTPHCFFRCGEQRFRFFIP